MTLDFHFWLFIGLIIIGLMVVFIPLFAILNDAKQSYEQAEQRLKEHQDRKEEKW